MTILVITAKNDEMKQLRMSVQTTKSGATFSSETLEVNQFRDSGGFLVPDDQKDQT